LQDWDHLDDELKSALLYSAIIHYARPFCFKKNYGGKKLRNSVGFDAELHEHLVNLRNELIAHQDNETLKAIVGHGYCDLALSGTTTTALISTQCAVKALHRINNKDVARRYTSHLESCISSLQEIMNNHLEEIHDMALKYSENADADTQTLASDRLPIEEAILRAPVPTALEARAARILHPPFPLPTDAYQYRVASVTHFRTGKHEIQTPLGTAIIELSDQPFPEPLPADLVKDGNNE
jgi:hypothetical protein